MPLEKTKETHQFGPLLWKHPFRKWEVNFRLQGTLVSIILYYIIGNANDTDYSRLKLLFALGFDQETRQLLSNSNGKGPLRDGGQLSGSAMSHLSQLPI